MGLTRRAVVLGKVQTAENTPATPNKYLNGLLVSNFNWNPDAPAIERNFLRDSLSNLPYRSGRKLMNATFDFELKAGPALGVRPEWSPLFRAAGMQETLSVVATSIRTALLKWTASGTGPAGSFYVDLAATGDPSITLPTGVRESGEDLRKVTALASMTPGTWWYGDGDTLGFTTVYVMLSDSADPDSKALGFVETVVGTSITYEFRDTAHEYGTFYIYPDGLLLQCTDALVDITNINVNAGGVATVAARLVAEYVTPTDVTLPTGVGYQSHLPPIAQNMAFTFDAFSTGVVPNFSVNFANQLSEQLDINSSGGFKGMRYTGRNPTGQVTMQQELVATFPAITRWENATPMTWSATMGSAGSRLTMSSPEVQITSVAPADINNGIRGWNLGLRFNSSTAVKEFRVFLD